MTYVMQFSNFSAINSVDTNEAKTYMVEVVTFDGDSETIYVDAHSEAEAMGLAASMVDDADYAMVQGIC